MNAAYEKYKDLKEGKNADYIPALAKVDPKIFGIALVTADGKVYTAGDLKSEVSIQSISKVFTMAKVIEESGPDAIVNTHRRRRDRHACSTRSSRSSPKKALGGPEMNPLVNPGAITATSMVKGATRDEIWNKILATYTDFAGRPLAVNQDVYKSEADTNQRNQAIGYADVRLRVHQGQPDAGDATSTRSSARSASTRRTSRRWRRRSRTAARTR